MIFEKPPLTTAVAVYNDKQMTEQDERFMRRAIELAERGMNDRAGGPFGAVVVKNGELIAEGFNRVTSENDPTAHAEVVAIREACRKLKSFQLSGCTIYTSCEPCPMCLGAIYWARPDRIVYACDHHDAAAIDFDDAFIYRELKLEIGERSIPFSQLLRTEALPAFEKWQHNKDVIKY